MFDLCNVHKFFVSEYTSKQPIIYTPLYILCVQQQGGMTLPSTSGKNKAMATIQKMRRRLTVTGASDTIDGVAKLGLDEKQAAAVAAIAKMQRDGTVAPPTITKCAVSEYSGVSKKGHAPYNPRKKNQDAH